MREIRCRLCPRDCDALRGETTGDGLCGCGTLPVVAHWGLHQGEEPCIGGKRGAGTVFFGGCALGCVYCQNSAISRGPVGKTVPPDELSRIYETLAAQGAACIDLVTPSHFAPAIRESLQGKRPAIPVVWNSSGYEKVQTLRTLEGLVDVYLPDLKYASPALAARYSAAPDYPETALAAIREMVRQTGPFQLDREGNLTRGVLIRHLLLPGQLANTRRVIETVAGMFRPGEVLFSLMSQYVPMGRAAEFPEINRRVGRREHQLAQAFLLGSGIEDGFVQSQSAAKKSYVPPEILEKDAGEGPKG